ncbi:hypothetical protein ACFQNE_00940 [Gordonia phosphorivorans]|uniref:Uncharacterized protein n=1 Tax=Gordonia phosphorivorans TaxID=1056982 RepID=A0ABV6H753_9ACTN
MKKILTRAAVAVTAAGSIGAGTLMAAAPAEAAVPNLRVTGAVTCQFGMQPGQPWTKGIWNMTRVLRVTAENGTFKNVTLQEVNGPRKFAPTLSSTGKVGDKKVPRSLEIKTVWPGCFPSSIAGWAISDYQENLLDNAGFWWNLKEIPRGEKPNADGGAQALLSGGGVDDPRAPQIPGVN